MIDYLRSFCTKLILAPAVADTEFVPECDSGLWEADGADVGLHDELLAGEEQGEVVMVVAGVKAGVLHYCCNLSLLAGQLLGLHLRVPLPAPHNQLPLQRPDREAEL